MIRHILSRASLTELLDAQAGWLAIGLRAGGPARLFSVDTSTAVSGSVGVSAATPRATVHARYLTRCELARYLGVSEKTVARWDRAGMPCERWGRRLVRYRLDRVEAWLERKVT